LSEDDAESIQESLSEQNEVDGFEEVQGEWELDDLVNDLHNDWSQHEKNKNELRKSSDFMSPKQDIAEEGNEFFQVQLSPVLEPVEQPLIVETSRTSGNIQGSNTSRLIASNNMGPWSIDWIQNRKEGFVFSSARDDTSKAMKGKALSHATSSKSRANKKQGSFKHSVGFMKRIARMPVRDRKQVLHFLKKHKRHNNRQVEDGNNTLDAAKGSTSVCSKDSKNSTSSVNKDWENWLVLHGKKEEVEVDVRAVGKVVGLHYHCDTTNSFQLLSKEGRREWRAVGGCELGRGKGGGTEGVVAM